MRRIKREHRLLPFTAGIASGYITTLIITAAGAALLLATDSVAALSGAVSITAVAASCFAAGRTAGRLRRHGGMAAGALCGVLYLLLPLAVSLVTFNVGGVLLIVKLLLCISFGAVGGIVGVNSRNSS